MKSRFLVLPAALALSACAAPTVMSNLNKDCGDQAENLGPLPSISNLPRNVPVYGVSASYGRFTPKTDCAQKAQPAPQLFDPSKIGGRPVDQQTASARACARSRA